MKRSYKNGIMVGIIILMIGAIYFTINMNKSDAPTMNGNPPNMPNGVSNNESSELPKNDNENLGDVIAPQTIPDNNNNSTNEIPNKGTPPEMPNNSSSNSITMYILLGIESFVISSLIVYLFMSNFNEKTFKETYQDKDKLVISGLIIIILTVGLTYLTSTLKNDSSNRDVMMPGGSNGGGSSNVSYSASKEITSDKNIESGSFSSTTSDENVITISNANSNLANITINKTGDSDGGDNTSFYGNNSAILAKDGAIVNITNATITTDANGANGVFSYGGSATTNNENSDGTTINISNTKITTTGNNAGGIMTTGGGNMNASDLEIVTSGISSAAIRSDRGGGIVNVSGGIYKTTGKGSPSIYSTADITVNNATLIATSSEGVVIEGANSVTLDNCELTDTNNSLNGQSTTYKNIFLYQSMSGDAKEGGSVFTARNSTITTNKGDSFYVTNTTATINLENNTIINNDNTGYFLRSMKDSWGNSGSNGGNVTLNVTNQNINGNIYIDEISTLTMNMNSSSYEGAINTDNIAKSITIKLDNSSKIKLTNDSYITSLEDADTAYSNIDLNGYKLYINGVELKK